MTAKLPQLEDKRRTSYQCVLLSSILGGGAIALSCFISVTLFAKDSYGDGTEAKTYVSSMNRRQQAYFFEKGTSGDIAVFTKKGTMYNEINAKKDLWQEHTQKTYGYE